MNEFTETTNSHLKQVWYDTLLSKYPNKRKMLFYLAKFIRESHKTSSCLDVEDFIDEYIEEEDMREFLMACHAQ